MYPPMEDPVYENFDNYEEVMEMEPLDFSENDVIWVASKISNAAKALGV